MLMSARSGDKIEGDLGVVISTLAKPEDVIADVSSIGNKINSKFAPEGEVILRAGTRPCKLVAVFDRKLGEVDPLEYFGADNDKNDDEKDAMRTLKSEWSKAVDESGILEPYISHSTRVFETRYTKKTLADEQAIVRLFNELFPLIKRLNFENAVPLTSSDQTTQDIAELRDTGFTYVGIGKDSKKRFFDFSNANDVSAAIKEYPWYGNSFEKELGAHLKSSGQIGRELSTYSKEKQTEIINSACKKFLDELDIKYSQENMRDKAEEVARNIEHLKNLLYWIDKAKSKV